MDAIVGRGGLLKPIVSGTYSVNDNMLKDLKENVQGEHASNLGAIIANEIARSINKPAFIVDPVVVDENGRYSKTFRSARTSKKKYISCIKSKGSG